MGATKSRLAKLQDVDEQFQFSQDDTELVPQLTSPRLPEKTLNYIRVLEDQNSYRSRQLDEVNAAIAKVSCGICRLPMEYPTLLSCGHTFCASCTRQNFKRQLEKKLTPSIWNIAIDPLFKTSIIAEYLISTGQDPAQVFSYRCPTCSATISKIPMFNRVLDTLITDLIFSIPDHEMQENRVYRGEAMPHPDPNTFFQDIFLSKPSTI